MGKYQDYSASNSIELMLKDFGVGVNFRSINLKTRKHCFANNISRKYRPIYRVYKKKR
jgi:hypothetical protein